MSDKKPLRMDGKSKERLIVFCILSAGSSDSHSGEAEVRTETFHVRFISKMVDRQNVHKDVDSKKRRTIKNFG